MPGWAHSADEDRHIFVAYVLLEIIAVHLAAAWHRCVRRDRATSRMIDGAPI
jgi:cytochrome b561